MKNILAIGAHSDDIEFGCAGTLLKRKLAGDNIYLLIMSCSDNINTVTGEKITVKENSRKEAQRSADLIGAELIFLNFISNHIPFNLESVTEIEKIIVSKKIDEVYTHWAGDTHQDHINTLNATMAASRLIKNVYCYEQVPLPRITSIYPVANLFVDITEFFNKKIECCSYHESQIEKYNKINFSLLENLEILAKYRGNQVGVKYAEAFNVLKMTL
jgi:LmbE family N-acetylglucosaminyl deacetylase